MKGFLSKQLECLCGWLGYDARPHLVSPWTENGYSYATNGHCLIRVPGSFGVCDPKKIYEFPKVYDFPWDAIENIDDCTYIDPVKLKSFEISHPCEVCRKDISSSEYKICSSCGGSGNEEIPARVECLDCHGTGIKMEAKYRLKDSLLSAQTLMVLHKNLPDLRFFPDASENFSKRYRPMIGFRFGAAGCGFLMKMRD